ncbi:hypothetical protein SAMN04490244_107183 [Tranquillimonas rosea]|uniref:Uncharacterized protein n=1 Tax=Tranquillimonas rosea TaxID=641238 RepID=A0A1H9VKS8_9RHOB|nr:hypothetical protein [Tranquillimonas rosea]SES22118.1 hypothetical protein SAMN04490244_107183 [Tranquillimonas rosea]
MADECARLGALAEADAQVAQAPEAAMDAVTTSMQGAMSKQALATMWEDVDLGLKLDDGLRDLLVSEGAWIVDQGVINAEAPTAQSLADHFSGDVLSEVAPDAVRLTK